MVESCGTSCSISYVKLLISGAEFDLNSQVLSSTEVMSRFLYNFLVKSTNVYGHCFTGPVEKNMYLTIKIQ